MRGCERNLDHECLGEDFIEVVSDGARVMSSGIGEPFLKLIIVLSRFRHPTGLAVVLMGLDCSGVFGEATLAQVCWWWLQAAMLEVGVWGALGGALGGALEALVV